MKKPVFIILAAIILSSCAVIRQGEVGVKSKFGKLNPEIMEAGLTG